MAKPKKPPKKPQRPAAPAQATKVAAPSSAITREFKLEIKLLDLWHAGSGRGSGQHLDALVVRDEQRLPYLPGKHLRGLLREALHCVESWGQASTFGLATRLLGPRGEAPAPGSTPGLIDITNATMLPVEHAWFNQNPAAARELFTSVTRTAMDHERGVALPKSLRAIELVVPMTLKADLTFRGCTDALRLDLSNAIGLVRAVGGGRNRGLGRARLLLEEVR